MWRARDISGAAARYNAVTDLRCRDVAGHHLAWFLTEPRRTGWSYAHASNYRNPRQNEDVAVHNAFRKKRI
jgi:hypothetical protein